MTFKIEGTTIYLTRGDSFSAEVSILNADGTAYTLQNGDEVKFALKSAKMKPGNTNYVDTNPRVQKTLGNDLMLELAPADTKTLPFGEYKYDLELTMDDGTVDTFVNNADFHLVAEVL